MSNRGSVSRWIAQVKMGHEAAAARLWSRYSHKLCDLARLRLRGVSRSAVDEEDVVLTAFESFLRRSKEGGYPQLNNRGELWRLLATITGHKALNIVRAERSTKRGEGQMVAVSPFPVSQSAIYEALANLASTEPNPELVVLMADSFEFLLSRLDDDELRQIAVGKLHGKSNAEIAAEINRSGATVERRLRLIRDVWREELTD